MDSVDVNDAEGDAGSQRPDGSPAPVERAASPDLLRVIAEGLTVLPYRAWFFGDSVAFEAMIAASDALADERYASFARGFARAWATHREPFCRDDCTAPGLAMVDLSVRTDDALLLEAALALADYLAERPKLYGVFETFVHSPLQHPYGPGRLSSDGVSLLARKPAGVFVDCLHFDPPFFVALGKALGERRFTDLGLEQALSYVELLQGSDGLFRHFFLEGETRPFGTGWGRGQGWALSGLLDVLERVPADDEGWAPLAQSAGRVVEAMVNCQRPDGHWSAVVHDPESGVESSTAAFMAWDFVRAAKLGLAGDAAQASAARALDAALSWTGPDGVLRGVSAAVNACTEETHYAHVPRGFVVPWGQGPLALALTAQLTG
jgi:unsaturated rhamnogalacturonyl hydrolase